MYVALLNVSNNYNCSKINLNIKNCNSVGLLIESKIFSNNSKIFIAGIYRPPQSNIIEFIEDFELLLLNHNKYTALITGDINIDISKEANCNIMANNYTN